MKNDVIWKKKKKKKQQKIFSLFLRYLFRNMLRLVETNFVIVPGQSSIKD